MDLERELAIRERIDARMREIGSMLDSPEFCEESEDLITAIFELEGLHSQLEAMRDDDSGTNAPESFIRQPAGCSPRLSSGAITLPEPEETDPD